MRLKTYIFLLSWLLLSTPAMVQAKDGAIYQALVAEFYLQTHEYKKSFAEYENLTKTNKSEEVLRRLFDLALALGDLSLIEKSSALIINENPDDTVAGTSYLVSLAGQGQAKQKLATAYIKKLYQSIKTNKASMLDMVKKLYLVKDRKFTTSLLEGLFSAIKPDKEDWHALAVFYSMNIKYDKALARAQKSIALDANWPDAHILKSRILYTQGLTEQAIDFIGKFYQKNYSFKTGQAYGRMLSSLGKFAEAIKVYEKLLKDKPNSTSLKDSLAGLYVNLKQYTKASEIYQSLIDNDELSNKANYLLGIINQELGKFKQAKENLQDVSSGEYYLDARLALAGLIGKEDVKAAIKFLDNIHSDGLNSYSKVVTAKAEIYKQAKDLKQAYAVYTEALDKSYNSDLYYARAILAEEMGRIDSMEEDLLTILDNDPDDVDALNALGYSLADKSNRHLEALSYIKKALKIRPDKFYILDSMGWVQYKLGQFDEALSYLLRAYKIKADPEVAAHLTEVFLHTGDKTQASKYFKLGNDLNAEHPAILKAKELLKDKGISY